MDYEGGVDFLNQSTQLARSIVRQVIEGGIKDVVVSPGSRNAPLLIAFHEAAKKELLTLHVRIDERTGGFFALGIAKATQTPVALLCTSGTAVANYHGYTVIVGGLVRFNICIFGSCFLFGHWSFGCCNFYGKNLCKKLYANCDQ